MIDAIFGGLLIFAASTGAVLIALYFLLWPVMKKRQHDYWCHRDNIDHGHDHGNQEPHI